MSKTTALVALMDGNGALTALTGGRHYPRRLPDKATLPAIVYNTISTVVDIGLTTDDRETRYRITPWAETALEVESIGTALHNLLDFGRSLPDIDRILADNETDRYDDAAKLYGRDYEFLVFGP